jgi:beta-N-acetylhexosaminidase
MYKSLLGKLLSTAIFLISVNTVISQSYQEREDNWVNNTLQNMSLDQKIGQLFIIRSYSRANVAEEALLLSYIENYHVGGICFFQGTPTEQVRLINTYQSKSKVPLFSSIDAEWGLGMRFPKETMSFPKQTTLGAISDEKMIYEMGRTIGRQCRAAGINVNFAPVVDLNSNPANPVIYDRSFGDRPNDVAIKAAAYARGLEAEGVLAVVKHFPGHGDTRTDSHSDIPIINHDRNRLEEIELVPFRRLTTEGISSIMVGHLHIPALDNKVNSTASISPKIMTNFMRNEMGFNGLIITDAMDMNGITKYHGVDGKAELEAFEAGADIILLPTKLPSAFTKIKNNVADGKISEERINESVRRILRAKFKIGLTFASVVPLEGLKEKLLSLDDVALKQDLYASSLTIVSDAKDIIPFKDLTGKKYATLSINVSTKSAFQIQIDDYVKAVHYQWMPLTNAAFGTQMSTSLSQFDNVIIGIHTSGKKADFNRDLPASVNTLIKNLEGKVNVVVCVFGHPYILAKLPTPGQLVCAYENDPAAQKVAAQSLFGALDIKGRLPVDVPLLYQSGTGFDKTSLQRLSFGLPESVGMSSFKLSEIDKIANRMIQNGATPGAQIVVARNGRIIHRKAYGNMTYNGRAVTDNTIYDLASLTKILSTTLATMKLVDEHKIDINEVIGTYINGLDTTDKYNLVIEDILAHHSRLMPGLVTYQNTVGKNGAFNPKLYSKTLTPEFDIPISRNFFLRRDYSDTLWHKIWSSPLRTSQTYRYSDIGLMMIHKVVESVSGYKLNDFMSKNFYGPIGLRNTSYLPLQRFSADNIAPSENDNYWRHQIVQGHVHDMGAAMMGGVSGHSGLFSTGYEVSILMQMLLNQGQYGGIQFIEPNTIKKFTTRYRKSSRRGLGFDMKELDSGRNQTFSRFASERAYGHTGFTGGLAMADPKYNLIIVITTNRTFPNASNNAFHKNDYRILIQDAIYEAILK